jgi:hypothetical protein
MPPSFRVALLVSLAVAAAPAVAADPPAKPALTAAEKTDGWVLLFDGETPTGWRGLGMDRVPDCWVVADGCLKCLGGTKGVNDLIADKQYENFEFAFEWRFPKSKGNSGVKYRVQEKPGQGHAFGPEFQLMNDPGVSDKRSTGALYNLVAPEGKKLAPDGEFNRGRIVARGNRSEHWVNGVKVVEAEFGSEALTAALAKSVFKNSDWGKTPRGFIALQNHQNEVLFRDLKIRELPAEPAK